MTKINFTNLPDTSTPLNATNMNALQTNVENAINGIITTGSNTSATYVKYADGTLIQYGKISLTTSDSRSSGGLTYYSQNENVTLPYSFVNTNYIVTTNVELANMNYFCQGYGSIIDTSHINISLASTNQSDTRNVDFVCIGTWK